MAARLELTVSVPLDLRPRPDPRAKPTDRLKPGVQGKLTDWQEDWVHIEAGRQKGWFREEQEPELRLASQRAARDHEITPLRPEALTFIRDVIRHAWPEDAGRESAMRCFDRLASKVELFADLARDAHTYLAGDPNAEARVLSLAQSIGWAGYEDEGECGSIRMAASAGLPLPQFPNRPAFPCFFDAFAFGRPFAAFRRMAETFAAGQFGGEDVFASLIVRLNPLVLAVERMEGLYTAARGIDPVQPETVQRFRRSFAFMTAVPASGASLPPPGEAPTPFPFPLPFPGGGGFRPLDPCAIDRWDRTERASRCFCREHYEIARMVNLYHELSDGAELIGEGCAEHRIRIEGSGFGSSREWGLGRGNSEVIFTGAGRDGVPVAAADYLSWSDTAIEVRVPSGARTGLVTLRILCRGVDVSACGVQLRHPRGDLSNRTFTIPGAPRIEQFSAAESAPACSDVSVRIRVRDAEVATLQDGSGAEVPFAEGAAGPRRDIDAGLVVRSYDEESYTLTVRNVCGESSESITVARRREFLIYPAGNVRLGEAAGITLEHYCTPEQLGRDEARFVLVWDDPDRALLDPPTSLVIGRTEMQVSVPLRTSNCGMVRVTARPEDPSLYDRLTSETGFIVYDSANLISIEASGATACAAFRFRIVGDCMVPQATRLRVRLTPLDGGRAQTARILNVASGPGGSMFGVILLCEAPTRLGTGRYEVTVEQFGLTSNRRLLTPDAIDVPLPRILRFTSSRGTVHRGERPVPIDLEWGVESASRVELWASGGRLGRGEGVIHSVSGPSGMCDVWSGSFRDAIGFPLRYELRAFAHGSDRVVTASLEITDSRPEVPEPMPVGVRELRVRNCAPDGQTLHVWIRTLAPVFGAWSEEGTVAAAYDSWGTCDLSSADDVTVSLDDGVLYELQLVDPAQSTCGGSNDPDLVNCIRLNPPAYILGDASGVGLDYVFGGGIGFY